MAQLFSQSIALPHREVPATPRLCSPAVATWLPLVAVLIGIASLFHLVQTSEVTFTGYNIQELQVEESNWKLRNEQLALEVARAKSLAVIETEAARRLGMVPAKEAVYLQPPKEVLASRTSPVSRGEARSVPELEKPASPEAKDPIRLVQQALSSALAPGHQSAER